MRLLRLRSVLLCARQDKDHIFCSDKYSFGPSKIEAYDLLVNRQEPYPVHLPPKQTYVDDRQALL